MQRYIDRPTEGDRQALGTRQTAVLLLLITLGSTAPSFALPGQCLLQVDGRTYLDKICNVELSADGSFSIGTGDTSRERHFAVVTIGPVRGRATGYWNGVLGEDRAHEGLGVLIRKRACWSNERAKICAFRKWRRKVPGGAASPVGSLKPPLSPPPRH